MVMKFAEMDESLVNGLRGGNGTAKVKSFEDSLNKVMMLTLDKGCSVGLHKHETNSEIQYIFSGEANFTIDGKTEIVKKGEVHYCPKGHSHTVINEHDEPLVMLCILPNQ